MPRASASFVSSSFLAGMIACEMTGSGKRMSSRTIGWVLDAQRVAGVRLLEADDGDDFARAGHFQAVAAVAHHAVNAGDALADGLTAVFITCPWAAARRSRCAGTPGRRCFSLTVLNARPENGSFGSGLRSRFSLSLVLGTDPVHRRPIERRRQVIHARRRAASCTPWKFFDEPHRIGVSLPLSVPVRRALAQHVLGHRLAFQHQFEQLVVGVRGGFQQVVVVLLGLALYSAGMSTS